MVERTVVINNRAGLHARPAALIVKTASKFESKITFSHNNNIVNGKSMMGIMLLGATHKSKISIIIEGKDEEKAIDEILKIFENNFYEE